MGKRVQWPRHRVVEMLWKIRSVMDARGLRPSSVEMADIAMSYLWKGVEKHNLRAMLIAGELSRYALVQMAGQLNRKSDPVAWRRGRRKGKVGTLAVARRNADGKPLAIRESPRWKQLTIDDLLEGRDRLNNQINGLGIHLETVDWMITLLRTQPAGTTVEDACEVVGIDPYDIDLDLALGGI